MPFNRQSLKRDLTVQEAAKSVGMIEAGGSQRQDVVQRSFSHFDFNVCRSDIERQKSSNGDLKVVAQNGQLSDKIYK